MAGRFMEIGNWQMRSLICACLPWDAPRPSFSSRVPLIRICRARVKADQRAGDRDRGFEAVGDADQAGGRGDVVGQLEPARACVAQSEDAAGLDQSDQERLPTYTMSDILTTPSQRTA